MAYTVPLTWTPCTKGGERPYFTCPGRVNGRDCQRRVAKLYGAGRYFLCRSCYGLAYASQSETPQDRLLRRANKLRRSLGGNPGMASPLPPRAKGMWQTTYDARLAEICELEDQADAHFEAWVAQRFPGIRPGSIP